MKAAAQTQRHTLIRHLVTATAWTLAQQLVVTVTGGGRGMGEEGLAMDEGRGGGKDWTQAWVRVRQGQE